MILVDTAVWIDHFRSEDLLLRDLLHEGRVVVHPWVIGEIAMGSLADRRSSLQILADLPQARVAEHDEVLRFVDAHALHGCGIGYINANLLVSALLTPEMLVWTRDKRLLAATRRLSRDAKLTH